jgi:hypothetical protein
MHFCDRSTVEETFRGKRVAIVGSGPGVLDNAPGVVDGHEVVVRINNFKLSAPAGHRTDVFYSFFGSSIRPRREDMPDVRLCVCKCPDAKFIESAWHKLNGKPHGVDFRYIYQARREWWFCPTYVPPVDEFLRVFVELDHHVPTTGFSAIRAVLDCAPAEVFLTGFDFFTSGIHNVTERWKAGNPQDPIGHRPDLERRWLRDRLGSYPIVLDRLARHSVMRDDPTPVQARRLQTRRGRAAAAAQ